MNSGTVSKYVKRTQKDYSMSFKLQVVSEIEQGLITKHEAKKRYGIQENQTISIWFEKFGNFDWDRKSTLVMPKSKDQKILELEQKVKLLEKKMRFLNINRIRLVKR
ncbi:hypothetical protein OAT16_08590 [Prolixibacteraceae bacterium]|nr:hypothetical protein [Prolixibacteraceae bacterium]